MGILNSPPPAPTKPATHPSIKPERNATNIFENVNRFSLLRGLTVKQAIQRREIFYKLSKSLIRLKHIQAKLSFQIIRQLGLTLAELVCYAFSIVISMCC